MMTGKGCYLTIEDWMFDLQDSESKKLSGTSLHLYALIYSYSKHGVGHYFGSIEYACERLRASKSSIKTAFKLLADAGHIEEVGEYRQGQREKRKWTVAGSSSGSASDPLSQSPVSSTGVGLHSEGSIYSQIGSTSPSPQNIQPSGSPTEASEIRGKNRLSEGQEPTPTGSISDPQDTDQAQVNQTIPAPKRNAKPNINPNNNPQSSKNETSRIEIKEEELIEAIQTLMGTSLNPSASIQEVETAYLETLKEGYTHQDILKGYEIYVRRYTTEYTTPRYAMRLDKFLRAPNGLKFYKRPSKTRSPIEKTNEEVEREFMDNHPRYADMYYELQSLFAVKARVMIGKPHFKDPTIDEIESRVIALKDAMSHYKAETSFKEVSAPS